MTKNEKIEFVENLSNKIKDSNVLYFTKYTGMSVEQATKLRFMFKENDVDYFISKNTLTKLAVKKSGINEGLFDNYLSGQIGIAYASDDPTAPAKVIKDFKKDNECLEVVGLYFDGKIYESDKYKEFASMPTKDELLTKLVIGLNSPMTKIAFCLKSSMSMLATVLNNLKDNKN